MQVFLWYMGCMISIVVSLDGLGGVAVLKRCRRNLSRLAALLLLSAILLVTGCFSVPKNAHLTIAESDRSLAEAFDDAAHYPHQDKEFLEFSEIQALAMNPRPRGDLQGKLTRFWETPIISNDAWKRGILPDRPRNSHLGEYLRVASWNIGKSLHIERIAELLASESAYLEYMDKPFSRKRRNYYLRQRERLASADVLILQEVDIGITRSGYIHGPEILAKALGMNYAYAPQQIEVGPVLQELAIDSVAGVNLPVEQAPDPERFRGVFGLLVLSKYPVRHADCFQLESHPYDWYANELAKYDALEGIRKLGTKSLFQTEILREAKVGGRIFFRVDLEVPDIPGNTLSVINVHLEIKAQAVKRQQQALEMLGHIWEIDNPVVFAGDFNSSRYDMSPTSLPRFTGRLVQNPNFWIYGTVNLLYPVYSILNTGRSVFNEVKNLHNPLAPHVPVALPNASRGLFTEIKDYRFKDGGRFDFRGDESRSINGRSALLSNSNQKNFKGYHPTFSVERPIGPFGLERLDWIFVKSGFYSDEDDCYRLAPYFGETINAFHEPLPEALSDHRPIVVDLPLQSP
jgi:endonuclease/exonuclease/phosphatase family metal-dependent hydrolase